MDGFVVGAQVEDDDELLLMVETTDDVVGGDGRGTRAVGHGRRTVRVRDLPIGDRWVVLVWHKGLWRCPDRDCEVKTFSEETDTIAPRAVLTERARAEICRRVGRDGHSVASVARDFGVSWHTAMQAVRDHGRPRVDHLSRLRMPSAIGVDETSFLTVNAFHPTAGDRVRGPRPPPPHRRHRWSRAAAVSNWLAAKAEPWLARIASPLRPLRRLRPRAGRGSAPSPPGGRPLPRRARAPRGAM